MPDTPHLLSPSQVFYTDAEAGTVSTMAFDGTGHAVVLSGLTNPVSVSVSFGSDWMWVASDAGLTRSRLNGDNPKVLMDAVAGLTSVVAAATTVYFTSSKTDSLYKMDVDGDHMEVVKRNLPSTPVAIGYLPGAVTRPWSKPGDVSGYHDGILYVLTHKEVVKMNTAGHHYTTVVSGLGQGFGLSIDNANGRLYFSDYNGTGVYRSGLEGQDLELVQTQPYSRAVCFYASSHSNTHAPTVTPTRLPTPRPTATPFPSVNPSHAPTPLPTPEPTWILGTYIFSAGEANGEVNLFKYVAEVDKFYALSKLPGQKVTDIHMARQGKATVAYFTDFNHGGVFKVPLTEEAESLPTNVAYGCRNASAITVPMGQDYVYFSCEGYTRNTTDADIEDVNSPAGYTSDRAASIMRVKQDGTGMSVIADSLGSITSMAATEERVYFVTKGGDLQYVSLLGDGLQTLASGFDAPHGLEVTARGWMGNTPVIYVADRTSIYRLSMDGTDKVKIIEGMYDCRGLALDLAHGRLVWADNKAAAIYSSTLNGGDIVAEVNVKNPYAVTYYTSTAVMKTRSPSHRPSQQPTPEPTLTSAPTHEPTEAPSEAPTLAPTYYSGRLFFTAGAESSNLYAADAEDGEVSAVTDVDDMLARGVSWTRSPPYVYWVDQDGYSVKRSALSSLSTHETIYTASEEIYDVAAAETYIFVTGGSTNSVVRMGHDGTDAVVLATGIASVVGIDTTSYYDTGTDSDSWLLYFVSSATGSAYSVTRDGGSLTTLLTGLENVNDVAFDTVYERLYIVCDATVWLADSDGANAVRLISGFTKAMSATIQYGWDRLWVSDFGADAIYQAELDGQSVVSRISVSAPRYLSFFWSTASESLAPTITPSTGPTEAPSQRPTHAPSHEPSAMPSREPTYPTPTPSKVPTVGPTPFPSEAPSGAPSLAPTVTPSYLFFTTGLTGSDGGKVWRAATNGADAEEFHSGGLPTGITVYYPSQTVFWADNSNGAIYSAPVTDGGSASVLVSGLTSPKKVALSYDRSNDASGPHLFWTDPDEGTLYRCGLDGTAITAMVTGVPGISGVVATYEYLYYSVPSTREVWRLDFTCDGGDDDGCTPVIVLAGVCENPADLSYSPNTFTMYAGCATVVALIKVFDQQGSFDVPIEVVLHGLPASGLNAVLYDWNGAGLYLSANNGSAIYFLPDGAMGHTHDGSDDENALLSLASNLTTISVHSSPRGVALYDAGLVEEDSNNLPSPGAGDALGDGLAEDAMAASRALLRDPARLFAVPLAEDLAGPLTDSRTVLASLDSFAAAAAAARAHAARSLVAAPADPSDGEPGMTSGPTSRQALLATTDPSDGEPGMTSGPSSGLLFGAAGAVAALVLLAAGSPKQTAQRSPQRRPEAPRSAPAASGYQRLD